MRGTSRRMARDKGGAHILLIPARSLHPSSYSSLMGILTWPANNFFTISPLTAILSFFLHSVTHSPLSLHLYYRAQTSEFAKKLRPEEEDHLAAAGFLRRKGKGEMTTFCIFKPGSCPFLRRLRRRLSRRVNKLSMTASLHWRLFILIAAFLRFY